MNRTARLVIAALLILGVGWSIAPRSALPLYDGIGFPDEPYRFVQRPAGAQETKPPTVAHGTASVTGAVAGSVVAASAEVAPQISLYIPKGKLDVPAGTSKVTVTGTPVQPIATGHGQYLWSDVYTVSASPGTTQFHAGGQQATITMRAASGQRPQPSIAYYTGGGWHLLPTYAQGQDIYIAELNRFGQFAVVGRNPLLVSQLSGGGAKSSSGGSAIGLIVGIGAGVVVVALFVLGRMRRARARAAEDDADEFADDDPDSVYVPDDEEDDR